MPDLHPPGKGKPMRKENPQFRWHLTIAEKRKIRRLTLKGIRQSVIARIMHLTAPTVSKVQVSMGLPTHLVIPEKKIMKLFQRGWGGYKISKHLHIPANQVYAVAHKNNFRRPDGIGYPTPHGDVDGFIEALKKKEGYIKTLAKKYGVGFCQARKIAHEVLVTARFRPGASKPPLSSDFPQKHFDPKMARPDQYVNLVQRVLEKCFNGKLPAVDDASFVAAMMTAFVQTCLEGQPQPVLDSFANGLHEAIQTLRMSETHLVN